jgi:hypothetical protein
MNADKKGFYACKGLQIKKLEIFGIIIRLLPLRWGRDGRG